MRKALLLFATLLSFGLAQENTFLVPERVSPRINVAVQIAKQLKERNFNRIAVVYMSTADLCAVFSASLVSSLKTLGVEAYYLKGDDPELPNKIKNLQANWIYLAHFGERPHDEVQTALNRDLMLLSSSFEKANLIFQPSTLALGFLPGALVDDKVADFLRRSVIKSFTVQDGKVQMVSVEVKDLEIIVKPEPEAKPTKKGGAKKGSR